MARSRIVVWLVMLVTPCASLVVAGEEPLPEAKAKVEFRWLEGKPTPGLTEDRGISISEDDRLFYPHRKPILTNADVSEIDVSKIDFPTGPHYTVQFHLTKAARKKLAESCGESGEKMMVAIIDGRTRGAPFYLKSRDEANFVPCAGMFPSKAEVEPVIAAFNLRKPKDAK